MTSSEIDLGRSAIEAALAAGADYADARVVRTIGERLVVETGALTGAYTNESIGIGVRVRIDGVVGFAGGDDLSRDGIRGIVSRAVGL
ncbi:MAG: PmbA/TldA family metallopeptidase, partial [Marmoricola sp.]